MEGLEGLEAFVRESRTTFEKLHQENLERSDQIIERLSRLEESFVKLLADSQEEARQRAIESQERSELLIKNTRRTALISERNGKLLAGTFALVVLSIFVVTQADPEDLANIIKRWLPFIGVLWLALLGSLFGIKIPSPDVSPPNQQDNATEPDSTS